MNPALRMQHPARTLRSFLLAKAADKDATLSPLLNLPEAAANAVIEDRRKAWQAALHAAPVIANDAAPPWLNTWLGFFAIAAVAGSVWQFVATRALAPWQNVLLCIAVLTLAALIVRRVHRSQHMLNVLSTQSCSKCGYALAGLSPIRTRACPECALPWPLVLPDSGADLSRR